MMSQFKPGTYGFELRESYLRHLSGYEVAEKEANFRTLDITRLNELCLASCFD
jgi:hypothetical protein